jgi:putative molybdopterin biosynthesis protein
LDLDFIPLATERLDLIFPAADHATQPVKVICRMLESEEFKSDVAQMKGYSTKEIGKVVYEG